MFVDDGSVRDSRDVLCLIKRPVLQSLTTVLFDRSVLSLEVLPRSITVWMPLDERNKKGLEGNSTAWTRLRRCCQRNGTPGTEQRPAREVGRCVAHLAFGIALAKFATEVHRKLKLAARAAKPSSWIFFQHRGAFRTMHLPAQRTGVQLRAPEGAKRPTTRLLQRQVMRARHQACTSPTETNVCVVRRMASAGPATDVRGSIQARRRSRRALVLSARELPRAAVRRASRVVGRPVHVQYYRRSKRTRTRRLHPTWRTSRKRTKIEFRAPIASDMRGTRLVERPPTLPNMILPPGCGQSWVRRRLDRQRNANQELAGRTSQLGIRPA